MNISNITDTINDYNNKTNDKDGSNTEIVIPLITIIPCGLSLICLISLMVYTLVKPLINKK